MSKEIKNIKYITDNDLCLSCSFCEPVCPTKSITVKLNENKGHHEPILDESTCEECGDCLKVCPGYSVDFPALNKIRDGKIPETHQVGVMLESMILYATDLEIRKNAASGGAITAIINYLFDTGKISGAFLTHNSYDKPFDPKGYLARNKNEVLKSQMSIYHSVPFARSIMDIEKIDGKVLIVGIPCQVHGLLKLVELKPHLKDKIYAIIGTFCGGYQTQFAHKYYFQKIGIDYNSISSVDYRYGEFPGLLRVGINGKKFQELPRRFTDPKQRLEYSAAFNANFYVPRCYQCADKSNILSDISAGDPWLPKYSDEKLGKSLCTSRTELGSSIIEDAVNAGYLSREDAKLKDVLDVQKPFSERYGNQNIYKKIFKLFGKKTPEYKYLGKYEPLSWRMYFRAFWDVIKPSIQRKPSFWFLIEPMYLIERNLRYYIITGSVFKQVWNKIKK